MWSCLLLVAAGQANLITWWRLLVIITWAFTLLLPQEVRLQYFLVQEVSRILLLFALWANRPALVFATLWVKLGVPPFHWWVIKISWNILGFQGWILFVVTKLVPIWLIFTVIDKRWILFLLWTGIVCVYLLTKTTSWPELLIVRRGLTLTWAAWFATISFQLAWVTLIIYLCTLSSRWVSSLQWKVLTVTFLSWIGIPPLPDFLIYIGGLRETLPTLATLTLLLRKIGAVAGYLAFFWLRYKAYNATWTSYLYWTLLTSFGLLNIFIFS